MKPTTLFRSCRVVLLTLLGWTALGGLRAESTALRAFRLGEPVPLTREAPTPALQVGVAAPEGLEWKPVGDGAWVAATVTLRKSDEYESGTFLSAYRPANDPKVAVLEFVSGEFGINSYLGHDTILIGRRREVDGTERPVRMFRSEEKGLLVLCEPIMDGGTAKNVLYRFAVGEPAAITLPLADGRLLALKSGKFAAEADERLRKMAARIDPANGGPDWSALDDDLVQFVQLYRGYEVSAGFAIHTALEPLLEPLAADLRAESPAAEESWRHFMGRVAKLREDYRLVDPRSFATAWQEALVAGGIAERGVFERLGRRGLRAAPGPRAETAEKLIALWREADRTDDHERLLALRAQWRDGVKDKAARAVLDRAIVPVLRREIARLRAENENPGTTAGLAFLAHQLNGGGVPETTTLGGLTEPAPDAPELNIARWYARVVLSAVWPVLAAEHAEAPRLVGFLNAHPDFAGNPGQALLGVRPGGLKEFSAMMSRRPDRVPLVLAGPALFLPATDAPPLEWRETFVNTDEATTTSPLFKQRAIVRRLRERPDALYEQYRTYGGADADAARQQLRDLARQRRALEWDQAQASDAAAKARQDWAAAQQHAWEHPLLVMKPTDPDYRHVTRGLSSAEMNSFANHHDTQVNRAAALQGSVNDLRAQENAALAAINAAGRMEKELIAELERNRINLAREETVLARLEAAEARRVFHAGVGEHDEERLEALRRYVGNRVGKVVGWLRERPDSPARARELQWWGWWLALDRPDLGGLPAEMRPTGYWLPEVAGEILAEELNGALGEDQIGNTYKAARTAIDRAVQHVSPLQLSQVLGRPLQEFLAKLTAEEQSAFSTSLDGHQQLIVSAALMKAGLAKP